MARSDCNDQRGGDDGGRLLQPAGPCGSAKPCAVAHVRFCRGTRGLVRGGRRARQPAAVQEQQQLQPHAHLMSRSALESAERDDSALHGLHCPPPCRRAVAWRRGAPDTSGRKPWRRRAAVTAVSTTDYCSSKAGKAGTGPGCGCTRPRGTTPAGPEGGTLQCPPSECVFSQQEDGGAGIG